MSNNDFVIENGVLTKYNGKDKDVVIPDSVTRIGDDAFRGCEKLVSITIPGGVRSIGNYAFSGCGSLTSITIPEGVTKIGDGAFDSCYTLTSIVIPDGVTSLGKNAFYFCTNLRNIHVPESVTSIGDEAFEFCEKLTSITIPNGVTEIGFRVFCWCKNLSSICLPKSVTHIRPSAFSTCIALKSLTVHGDITQIGGDAFQWCLIERMEIPKSFLEMDYKELESSGILPSLCLSGIDVTNNKRLKNAVIRNTKKQHEIFPKIYSADSGEILSRVLSLCEFGIEEVDAMLSAAQEANAVSCIATLLDYKNGHFSAQEMDTQSEKEIGISERSLKEWKKILKLSVKDGKIAVGGYAGLDSETVKEIVIPNEIEGMPIVEIKDNAFREMRNLTKITIPEGVVRIGKYAFSYCVELSEIELPDSLEEIDNRAFENCGLKELRLSSNVKKMGYDVFGDCTAKVIAPAGSYAEDYVNPAPIKIVDGVLVRCNVIGTTHIIIPDGVTEFADRVLCYQGADITIPESVKTISPKAFYYCRDITIHGKAGSSAEKIAKKMKFDFIAEGAK